MIGPGPRHLRIARDGHEEIYVARNAARVAFVSYRTDSPRIRMMDSPGANQLPFAT